MSSVDENARRLIANLRSMNKVAVAFSGGVDSSVVAAAAQRAMPGNAIAVTADSPSLSKMQLAIAIDVAAEIGIEQQIIRTDEGEREEYQRNDAKRCFYCKQTLYTAMQSIVLKYPGMQIVSGTNADDLGDYRPGLKAGRDAGVRTPLADLGLGKAEVRELASHFGLTNKDLPAAPCLASRIAYGTQVTRERLRRVELAEDWLRRHGFAELRVRLHDGELARLEVPRHLLHRLIELDKDLAMTHALESFGFKFITIDTRGFRSGNLNQMLVSIGDPITAAENESTP